MAKFSPVLQSSTTFNYDKVFFVATTDDATNNEFVQGDVVCGILQSNAQTGVIAGYTSWRNVTQGAAIATTVPAPGTNVLPAVIGTKIPLTQEVLTVDATAAGVGFAAKPADANYATALIADADIRVRVDGTAPTAAVGFEQQAGSTFELESELELTQFKAIRTAAVDASLTIQYYTVIEA